MLVLSGRDEQPDKVSPTGFPICINCGCKHWYRSFEAWEDTFLEEDGDDIYQYNGDELRYGERLTSWRCVGCLNTPNAGIRRRLTEHAESAEWI